MNKFEQIIEDAFRNNFIRIEKQTNYSQFWKGEWWIPINCDSTQDMFEEIKKRIHEIRAKKG